MTDPDSLSFINYYKEAASVCTLFLAFDGGPHQAVHRPRIRRGHSALRCVL